MRFLIVIAAAIVAACGFALGIRLYMSRANEDRLRPGEDIAIAALRAPLPQNGFLACPPGYCGVAGSAPAPVFDLPEARLEACWRRMIAGERQVVLVAGEPNGGRAVYIQHTPLLRFPDIVTVEFSALGPARSSLAVYSKARYGRSDFGTNRRRVERWLAKLADVAHSGAC
jgi:hypothetical protein